MNKDYLPGERRLSSAEHALQPDVNKKELVDDKIDMYDAKKDQPTRPARLGNFLYALTDGVILKQEHVTRFLEKRDAKRAAREAKRAGLGKHAVNNSPTVVIPRVEVGTDEVAPILKIPTHEDLNRMTVINPHDALKASTVELPALNPDYEAKHKVNNDKTVTFPKITDDTHAPSSK